MKNQSKQEFKNSKLIKIGNYLTLTFHWIDKKNKKQENMFFIPTHLDGDENFRMDNFCGVNLNYLLKEMQDDYEKS